MLGILSIKGKIGRLSYFLTTFFAFLSMHLCMAYFFINNIDIDYDIISKNNSHSASVIFLYIAIIAPCWLLFAATIKRLRDLNWNLALVILGLLPICSVILFTVLCLTKADKISDSDTISDIIGTY